MRFADALFLIRLIRTGKGIKFRWAFSELETCTNCYWLEWVDESDGEEFASRCSCSSSSSSCVADGTIHANNFDKSRCGTMADRFRVISCWCLVSLVDRTVDWRVQGERRIWHVRVIIFNFCLATRCTRVDDESPH